MRVSDENPEGAEEPQEDRDNDRRGGGGKRLWPEPDKIEVHHAAHDRKGRNATRRHAEQRGAQPNERVFII